MATSRTYEGKVHLYDSCACAFKHWRPLFERYYHVIKTYTKLPTKRTQETELLPHAFLDML